MALDNTKNFAKVTVSTGYNSAATSIVLSTGDGAKLPTAPFNATWWNSTDYADPSDDPSVEIVRVTAIATDTLTVTRGQESTSASNKNTAAKTYKMIAGLSSKTIDDLKNDIYAVVTKTANYTLTGSDHTVLADATSAAFTLTLPTAVGITGKEYIIKRIDAALTNLVTIATTSSQTIDGKTSLTINNRDSLLIVKSDGSNWRIIDEQSFDAHSFRAKGSTLNRWYSAAVTAVAAPTMSPSINFLRAIPLVISKTTTIDQMAISVTTLGAGSNIRVGIYADDGNCYPGALIVDAGANPTTAISIQTYTTNLPVTLLPGLYWLASVGNGTAPSIRGIAATGFIPILGLDSAFGSAWGVGWQVSFTYAALPNPFTAGGTISSAAQPGIFFRTST